MELSRIQKRVRFRTSDFRSDSREAFLFTRWRLCYQKHARDISFSILLLLVYFCSLYTCLSLYVVHAVRCGLSERFYINLGHEERFVNLGIRFQKPELETSMKCHYKQCKLPPLSKKDARIEIKAVLPRGWSGASNMSSVVDWKRNGEACFHKACWQTVVAAAKSRRSGQTNVLGMKQSEKLMVRQAAQTAETFDSASDVEAAAKMAAGLIQNSSRCIAFTGAGISTSAGLGDFRGKSGKWTEEDQSQANDSISAAFQSDQAASGSSSGVASSGSDDGPPFKRRRSAGGAEQEDSEDEEQEIVDYENLRPTYTHESMSLLLQKGFVCYIISQNCDGLHLLSGVPADKLSELHGDVFVEKCEKCGKRYLRDYYVLDDVSSQYFEEVADYGKTEIKKPKHALKCSLCGLSHRTGRKCEEEGCHGYLMDTIINFRDHLEEEILDRAAAEADRSDLILCLGTTLTVTPAADLVDMAKGKQPLVICNLQKTEKDEAANVRVFGDCDGFMRQVIHHLMPEEDWQDWENGRQGRMEEYQQQRTTRT